MPSPRKPKTRGKPGPKPAIDAKARGRGRPNTYDPRIHPVLVRCAARSGMTGKEIAQQLGVHLDTLYDWSDRYAEFSEALKDGKDFTDGRVEDSLFKRAIGYDFLADEVFVDAEGSRKTKRVKKHVPPDVTAQIFWLKNRKPKQWRDKRDHVHTGADDGPIQTETKIVTDLARCAIEFEGFSDAEPGGTTMGSETLPPNGGTQPLPESGD